MPPINDGKSKCRHDGAGDGLGVVVGELVVDVVGPTVVVVVGTGVVVVGLSVDVVGTTVVVVIGTGVGVVGFSVGFVVGGGGTVIVVGVSGGATVVGITGGATVGGDTATVVETGSSFALPVLKQTNKRQLQKKN